MSEPRSLKRLVRPALGGVNEKLRACPFCARIPYVKETYPGWWIVGCLLCGFSLKPWGSRQDAIHVWNMRPEADGFLGPNPQDEGCGSDNT